MWSKYFCVEKYHTKLTFLNNNKKSFLARGKQFAKSELPLSIWDIGTPLKKDKIWPKIPGQIKKPSCFCIFYIPVVLQNIA